MSASQPSFSRCGQSVKIDCMLERIEYSDMRWMVLISSSLVVTVPPVGTSALVCRPTSVFVVGHEVVGQAADLDVLEAVVHELRGEASRSASPSVV